MKNMTELFNRNIEQMQKKNEELKIEAA